MFGRLLPKEGKFFDLFNEHAEFCVKGAREMVALMTNFDAVSYTHLTLPTNREV